MAKKIKIASIAVCIVLFVLLIKNVLSGKIDTVDEFQEFMNSYGILGPFMLTVVQAFQVVVPVLPGYFGCIVGAISYGTFVGFLCNYIGISVGSIIAFFLAEHYGKKLVIDMFSEKLYDKWAKKIEGKKSYDVFLFIATLLPLFPDDFLCYFSGLIRMDRRKFIWIIILGKPWCILVYSIIFGLIQ